MDIFIVYKKGYKEDVFGYPQGQGIEIIDEIISVRLSEDVAKEEIRNSTIGSLSYVKKTVK